MGELDLNGIEWIRRTFFPNQRDKMSRQLQTGEMQNQLAQQEMYKQWLQSQGRPAMEAQWNAPIDQQKLIQAQTQGEGARGEYYKGGAAEARARATAIPQETAQSIKASEAGIRQEDTRNFNDWLQMQYNNYNNQAQRAQQAGQFDQTMGLNERQLTQQGDLGRLNAATSLMMPVPSTVMQPGMPDAKGKPTYTQVQNPQITPIMQQLGFGQGPQAQADPGLTEAAKAVEELRKRGQASPPGGTNAVPEIRTAPSVTLPEAGQGRPIQYVPSNPLPENSWLKRLGTAIRHPFTPLPEAKPQTPTQPPPADPRMSDLIQPETTNHAQSAQYMPQQSTEIPQLMQFISQEVQQNPQMVQQLIAALLQGGV